MHGVGGGVGWYIGLKGCLGVWGGMVCVQRMVSWVERMPGCMAWDGVGGVGIVSRAKRMPGVCTHPQLTPGSPPAHPWLTRGPPLAHPWLTHSIRKIVSMHPNRVRFVAAVLSDDIVCGLVGLVK